MNDPLATVLEFFRSFEGNDVEEAVKHVSDDLEYVNVPFGFEAGTVIGPDGMRAVLVPATNPRVAFALPLPTTMSRSAVSFTLVPP